VPLGLVPLGLVPLGFVPLGLVPLGLVPLTRVRFGLVLWAVGVCGSVAAASCGRRST
jgi:hypothetical protein